MTDCGESSLALWERACCENKRCVVWRGAERDSAADDTGYMWLPCDASADSASDSTLAVECSERFVESVDSAVTADEGLSHAC